MELNGRVALVTGSARRLGRSIAGALAQAGCAIAIHHHCSPAEAADAVHECRALEVEAAAFQADLEDPRQIDRLFAELESSFGQLDILVNNAAIFAGGPAAQITPEEWDRVMDLNLRAPFFCCQQAARLMQRAGAGSIVNIADVAAFQAWPGYAHYCVSKAGLVALTRVLARALAPEVRVNAVAPGPVLPPEDVSPDERERLAELTALKRLGEPDDVVQAVLFLVGSDYITGETIIVDGGKLLRS
ncbi:MAG: SDR family oxidoreductase [Gemmatimonadetes bacterium]|nr:SDR family oxidoreductase [Gemmatimonadota bacterium]NIO32588.1 SDR family oxidoreductase [Gemmatimonadota bacterium]